MTTISELELPTHNSCYAAGVYVFVTMREGFCTTFAGRSDKTGSGITEVLNPYIQHSDIVVMRMMLLRMMTQSGGINAETAVTPPTKQNKTNGQL